MKDKEIQIIQVVKTYDKDKDLYHYSLYLVEDGKRVSVISGYNLKKVILKGYQILD